MRVAVCVLLLIPSLYAEDPLPSTKLGWLVHFTPQEQLADTRLQFRAGRALQRLADPSLETRDQAEQDLVALGSAVLPQLAEILEAEPAPELRFRLLRVLDSFWRQPPAAAFPERWEEHPLRDNGAYQIEATGEVGPFEGRYRVLDADSQEVYAFDGHSQQSWCVRAEVLYLTEFHSMSSGCSVAAIDLADGALLWRAQLAGLGRIAHSKYSNSVNLIEAEGELAVFGNEAAGRYYEVLASEDGRQLFHMLVP